MTYTPEITAKLLEDYNNGIPIEEIAKGLDVPIRSVIAKLSSLGAYKKKVYVTKQGLPPVKKSEYIERIADLLDMNLELLESLEKTNKQILQLMAEKLQELAELKNKSE